MWAVFGYNINNNSIDLDSKLLISECSENWYYMKWVADTMKDEAIKSGLPFYFRAEWVSDDNLG